MGRYKSYVGCIVEDKNDNTYRVNESKFFMIDEELSDFDISMLVRDFKSKYKILKLTGMQSFEKMLKFKMLNS